MTNDSYLHREITEQPAALARFFDGERTHITRVVENLRRREISYVLIAARGSSDSAATYAKYIFGARLHRVVALAAPSLHTVYGEPPDMSRALVIAISQSGESTDILAVLQHAQRQGVPTLAITNRDGSALARAADEVILLHAGEEKSIAATKTYTCSLAAMALLAALWSGEKMRVEELLALPEKLSAALQAEDAARALAGDMVELDEWSVIGRGFNYCTALELSLKLKELAYVRAEPYSPADFLHGPFALVDQTFRALVIAPSGQVYANVTEFAEKLKREGARLMAISDRAEFLQLAETGLILPPNIPEWLSPLVAVVPGQLFALHLAAAKGYDVDHPRRLTKITRTL